KVMGIIGISIGAAFVLAIVLGAPLARIGGLAGLFGLTAVLALAAIGLLWVLVPRLAEHRAPAAARPGSVLRMLVKPQLTVLNVSVFMMHTMLTAAFVALPLMLKQDTGIALGNQWELYLPVMLISAVIMGGELRPWPGAGAVRFQPCRSWPSAVVAVGGGVLQRVQPAGGQPAEPGVAAGAGAPAWCLAGCLCHLPVPRCWRRRRAGRHDAAACRRVSGVRGGFGADPAVAAAAVVGKFPGDRRRRGDRRLSAPPACGAGFESAVARPHSPGPARFARSHPGFDDGT